MSIFTLNQSRAWGLTLAAVLAGVPALAQTIDGTRDGSYPAALAVQTNATGFGDANNGAILNANGSEVDNIHAQVVGSDLYIFVGGNLEASGNTLELWIDSRVGGQSQIQSGNGGPATNATGLKFDSPFAADYLVALAINGGNLQGQFTVIGTGAGSNNIGQGNTGGASINVDFDLTAGTNTGEIAINNSNTAGVSGGAVGSPGSVATGAEFRIPLSAIGNPTGNILVMATINNNGHNFLSNQILAGLPASSGNLGGDGAGGFTGTLSGVDMSAITGTQYVTIPYSPMVLQPDISVAPTTLRYGSVLTTSGSSSKTFTITNTGGAPLNVSNITSTNPAFSASPTTVSLLGVGLSQTITVTFDPSIAGTQTGTITVVSDAPNTSPHTVSVRGIATAPGTAIVDGTRDATYPASLALQTNATGFGDSNSGDEGSANGSEIDNVHAQIIGSDLYVFIGGNVEANGNNLELFFDSKPNVGSNIFGQNVLAGNGGPAGAMSGLTFDSPFYADYAVSVKANGSGGSFTGVDFSFSAIGTPDGGAIGSGATPSTSQALDFDLGAGNLSGEGAINNMNTAGVTGAAVGTPGSVDTGVELRIPLSALGTSLNNGPIRLTAFINSGDHTFASNQFLAGLPANSANVGSTNLANLSTRAGNQFVTIANGVAPALAFISATPTSLNFFNVAMVGGSASRTLTIENSGTAALNISSIVSSNPAFSVSPTVLSIPAGSDADVTVTFDPSVAGTNSGTLFINSNAVNNAALDVDVTGKGIAPGSAVVDGILEPAFYGAPIAVQNNATGFGDNFSELDAAYATISGSRLNLFLAGNLETNGNKLVLLFDNSPLSGSSTYSAATMPSIGNSDAMDGLIFEQSFTPEYMVVLNTFGGQLFADFAVNGGSASVLSATNTSTQTLNFPGGLLGELAADNSNTAGVTGSTVGNPGAVTKGFELSIPITAIAPGYSSATPLRVTAFIVNGNFDFLSNQVLGGIGTGLPNSNVGNIGSPSGKSFADGFAGTQFFTVQRGDVTVAAADDKDLKGEFRNVSVDGLLNAYDYIDVTGLLNVRTGGTLDLHNGAGALVTGTGGFALRFGSSLLISNANGIAASGNSGAVRNSGSRLFNNDASYTYYGAGETGNGLPAIVRNLSVSPIGAGPITTTTLTQNVSVRQKVQLNDHNINLDGHNLRLLSDATGTALIVHDGNGTVIGNTGQMECALTGFGGTGYRHYSSPTSGMTFGGMSAPGFQPIVDAAYNSPTPPTYTAATFPNVFLYNEAAATTDFSAGYQSPANLTDQLGVGRGYSVRLIGKPEITFSGTFSTGDKVVTVSNSSNASNGWNLLGNPYPSPIDWNSMGAQPGMSGEIAVFQPAASATGNGGSYLVYNNGVGNLPGGIVPAMQGVFVRRSAAGSGSFTFNDLARVTTFGSPGHYRTAQEARPIVRLQVAGTGALATLTDEAFVYFEAGATGGTDDRFDALRVAPSTGDVPTISTRLADGKEAQIDGRPELTRDLEVPLVVRVNRTGTYTLRAADLRNFAADQQVILVDALTGTQQDLSQQPEYRFSMEQSFAGPRFSLRFGAGTTAGAASANALLSVYPNPSAGSCTVEWAGTEPLTGVITLTDLLGRNVRTMTAGAARLHLTDLPKGVYTLRATSSEGPLTRRIVVE
jgi:Abnormal spindle-like microcephaly-assoc'd, ASPM-SPD-2-Hydin/Protein of unknown function (DUF1573)/Secretion system C-terminal sorting domain